MSKAKRKRPEDEASDGTRASPRTRGVSGAGGASATRPDGGADGGVKKEPGDDDSAGASPGRARHRASPRVATEPKPKRGKRERTWRDLSQNALYDIVRRLQGPHAVKTRKRDLVETLEKHVRELITCAVKLLGVSKQIAEHLKHTPSSFQDERTELLANIKTLYTMAKDHVTEHADADPRSLSADKIVRARLNAALVAASLPILAAFLRDSVCEACPAATIAACRAFEALRVEVQLRTSVRVYREMPALRKTLYDGAVSQALAAELVTRVFGKIEDEDEAAAGGERRSGDDEGVHDVWVDGSVRVAPPQSLVDALFSASSHDDAYGQTVNDPVTGGSGEDEGESLESARTWAGLWGETHDVHPANQGLFSPATADSPAPATRLTADQHLDVLERESIERSGVDFVGRRRSARIATRPEPTPTPGGNLDSPQTERPESRRRGRVTLHHGARVHRGAILGPFTRSLHPSFRQGGAATRRHAVNLSHDPRFRTGGLDHFFGDDDDDEGPRYPESLAPPAPWTLVNVHGDSDDDVWDVDEEEPVAPGDVLEQARAAWRHSQGMNRAPNTGAGYAVRTGARRGEDGRLYTRDGRVITRAEPYDNGDISEGSREDGFDTDDDGGGRDGIPRVIARRIRNRRGAEVLRNRFEPPRSRPPVGLSWDSELSNLFNDFPGLNDAAVPDALPDDADRPPTRRGGGSRESPADDESPNDESPPSNGTTITTQISAAKSAAMRTSVQLLARLVKYELFRRDAIPHPSTSPPASNGSGGGGSSSTKAREFNPPGGRSPLVPTFSASGLKMLRFLTRPDDENRPDFTVLELLTPHLKRDGRVAVLLACGCELFAARDALRMCPFEACAGVYTCAAARVLATVAHQWHVHGVPKRNAADGWIALTKLAETITESCVAGRVNVINPRSGLGSRPFGGLNPSNTGEPGQDGAAVSTSAAGFLAGIAGNLPELLGKALPALTSTLIASRPPQRIVNSFAESTLVLAHAAMHPPPPQFGSPAYLNHHGVKPAMLQSTLGERMRTAALLEIEPALVAVEVWARNGVLAHLKAPTADRVQAADDCSSVAALVCAAALVSRVDAVHVENTRRCLFNEGDIADMVSRFENVVQLEPRQLNDLLRVFMRRLSDVVCAWPGVDSSAFEPLEGTHVALSDDAELIGDFWVISADSGSLTPLCPSTPAARAMRSTLEAIELAVERVLTAAWLSSASAAGAGRRGGDPWAHGDVFVNDDATIRENDALRNAFSTGAMAAPLKTLVTAAGAIDAAARILRADALDPSKFDLPGASSKSVTLPDVSREMSLLVRRFRSALSRLVDADPSALCPPRPLQFLERYPHCVSFAAKFKRLQREIRALHSTHAPPSAVFGRVFEVEVSRSDTAGDFYDVIHRIYRRAAVTTPRGLRGLSGGATPTPHRGGLGLMSSGGASPAYQEAARDVAAEMLGFGGPGGVGRAGQFPAEVPLTDLFAERATNPRGGGGGGGGSTGTGTGAGAGTGTGTGTGAGAARVSSPRTVYPHDALRGMVINASFRGELGNGPGVVREAFQLAATALLADTDRALFRAWPGSVDVNPGENPYYHVNPLCAVGDSPLAWRFVGRFIGLCVTSGCHVRLPLVPWLWDQLLYGADGGFAPLDPRDRFIGEKLGRIFNLGLPASTNDLPAMRRIKEAMERHPRRGGGTVDGGDGSAPEDDGDDGSDDDGFGPHKRRTKLERLLGLSAAPEPDAPALRWLDSMAEIEPEFHRSLIALLRAPMASEQNAWAMDMLTFSREASGDDGVVELVTGGAEVVVTDENKARYVAALARHRATVVDGASTLKAVRSMREGLNDVVPTRLLRGFSPEDLRRLVCGVDTLCPKAWRSATRHSDFSASASTSVQGGVGGVGDGARGGEHAVVGWFWRAVESLTPQRRSALLQFWTGASTLGPTGFDGCEFRLTLAHHLAPHSLPESQTCSRTIKLAEYGSFDQLRRKLIMALDFGAAGFAFA